MNDGFQLMNIFIIKTSIKLVGFIYLFIFYDLFIKSFLPSFFLLFVCFFVVVVFFWCKLLCNCYHKF